MSWERAARWAVLALYAPLLASLCVSVPVHAQALRAGWSWPAALSGLATLGLLYAAGRRAAAVWEGGARRLWADAALAGLFLLALLRWARTP